MKKSYITITIIIIIASCVTTSCKKYLDKKPDKALQIPTSLKDLQALLDDGYLLNGVNGVSFDEASADDYYTPDDLQNDLSIENKNAYIWQNFDYRNYPNDWAYVYNMVNITNLVLDKLEHIDINPSNSVDFNNINGSAHFYRAFSFLHGANIFCKAYDENTANQDLGLVLRLTSDITLKTVRSSVRDTYNQIISDLNIATATLPDLPRYLTRPSKNAAFALLARVYLSMRKYDSCLKYSNLSFQLRDDLMNYNNISVSNFVPFQQFNKEVVFHYVINQPAYATIDPYYARVDSTLYDSYNNNDLRKEAFFYQEYPGYTFKGNYSPYQLFTGLTTDEVLLMRSECYARLGDKDKCLSDLNLLMVNRWKTGTFTPFSAATPADALKIVLTERRKELIFRDLRWMDIKRLNKEGANIILKRKVNGQVFQLLPNDNRYALALPTDIIDLTGILQNPH